MKTNPEIKWYLAGLAGLITFFVYLPALRNEFAGVWDDNMYIFENVRIQRFDLAFFRWAFFHFYASNWHPLTWISHALDYAFWGLNPLGHHLTSVILHAVNAFLAVVLVTRLLAAAKERAPETVVQEFLTDRAILVAAGSTGLLFGIHPVHVESVAWAAERKDVLCGMFFLLSLIAYTAYAARAENTGLDAESGNAKAPSSFAFLIDARYLAALALFVLSLLSKSMAVSLPVVLLILDWYPFRRIRNMKTAVTAGLEKLPFVCFSLAAGILAILAQISGESILSLKSASVSTRLLVSAKSLVGYLSKMILPFNLAPYYPYPKNVAIFSPGYLSAVLILIAVTAFCLAMLKKQHIWAAAWAFYAVTLLPVIGLVQSGNQAMADRYTYLPSLGPLLVTGVCAAWLDARIRINRLPVIRLAGPACAFAVVFFLSSVTIAQIGIWKNDFVLWDSAISRGYESATAFNNRGVALDKRGQPEKAAADFERAIAIDPSNYFAYNNWGVLYGKAGQYARSIEYFQKALAINARHADCYCNLGVSYFSLKEYAPSLQSYNKAIGLKGDFDAAYLNRGNLYYVTGDQARALQDYRRACGLGNDKACEVLYLASHGVDGR